MRILVGVLLCLGLIGTATAQRPSPWPPAWIEPVGATHIVGPIYSVGTRGLANYLITTEAAHILIDGSMPQTAASVEASIRKPWLQARGHQVAARHARPCRSRRCHRTL